MECPVLKQNKKLIEENEKLKEEIEDLQNKIIELMRGFGKDKKNGQGDEG